MIEKIVDSIRKEINFAVERDFVKAKVLEVCDRLDRNEYGFYFDINSEEDREIAKDIAIIELRREQIAE